MYEEYLMEEKKLADVFLKHKEINDDRFNEDEYHFIKHFFNDKILINNIFSVIDDLINIDRLDIGFRYLILGDFFFSMRSLDLKDASEIIFKTTRSEYIERIRLRSLINNLFINDMSKYIKLHKKLLIGLRLNNSIQRTIIRSFDNGSWESTIYYKLIVDKKCSLYVIPIVLNRFPFIVVEINKSFYSIGSFRNIWKVKRKKREMVDMVLSYDGVAKTNMINFELSSKLYEMNKDIITKEETRLLEIVKCANFDEYINKIVKIVDDRTYANKLIYWKETISDVKFSDFKSLYGEINAEYLTLFRNFQKLISLNNLHKNILDISFYLPCFMDNRSRLYLATLLSPTFYLLYRYLYIFKIEKDFCDLEESTYYKKITYYCFKVEKFKQNIKISYVLIVLFIEIGKFYKKFNNSCFLKTSDLIDAGIENYEKKNIDVCFEESLYIKKIYTVIENILITGVLDYNTIIFKDATASGLQNYGIILGYKKEQLKYLNINGEDWCDTYQYIIEKFVEKDYPELIKRKYLKSTIMTIPYNAVWFSCLGKYLDALREDGIEFKNFCEEKQNRIISIHRNFYNNIKKNIKSEFYTNQTMNLKYFDYNKWTVVNTREYKINYKKARDKYVDTLYMINHDEKNTAIALEANNMHYRDAELVHHLLEKFELLTIHDCFGVRLSELHKLIDSINTYYSNHIGVETYSIHIII